MNIDLIYAPGGVIVEGPDGSGKSTLIRSSIRTLVPRHCSSDGPYENLAEWVERDLVTPPSLKAVYDRYPLISELIYGPVIRGELSEGFSSSLWLKYCWGHFLKRRPRIVVCLPPLEVVINNIQYKKQMRGVSKHIETIYWLYWSFAHQMKGLDDRLIDIYDYTRGKNGDGMG